tara:strand:+ start:2303 stop:3049 length:747 start_codon:yes stop_codon:yes gene_type:complete
MPQNLNHLAIIMDGNRRWARNLGIEALQGHNRGADTLIDISQTAIDQKIEWLTVFAFSSENWQRPRAEVTGLLALMKRFVTAQSEKLIDNNIRLRVVGRRDRFSSELQQSINNVELRSSLNSGLNLTVALDYGGKQDIAAAAAQIAHEVETGLLSARQVNDDLLKSRLSTKVLPPVDLLIRTGGEKRLSNFMLWDLSYAELVFSDKHWPEYAATDFLLAIDEYYKRDRRYGVRAAKIHHIRMVKSDLT